MTLETDSISRRTMIKIAVAELRSFFGDLDRATAAKMLERWQYRAGLDLAAVDEVLAHFPDLAPAVTKREADEYRWGELR